MRTNLSASCVIWAAAIMAMLAGSAPAADWPRFRGPNGDGLSPDSAPAPVEWSEAKNLKWKTALPGPGLSSPIIVGDRVFVTCYSGYGDGAGVFAQTFARRPFAQQLPSLGAGG